MKNHQIYSTNSRMDISTVSLISAYNTHVYGYYRNLLIKEKPDMHCLIISLRGQAEIELHSGKKVALPEKGVFFGRLSSMHALLSDCPHWHFVCFWFIPHNIDLPLNQSFHIKSLHVDKEDDCANKIIRLLQMNLDHKTKYANSYFCFRLLEHLENIDPIIQKSTELTDKIINHINNHIEEDLQIKAIAQTFHYSEKHIRSLFNNTLHVSPKQYLIKVKLENVCHLLLNSDLSLQELAEKYCFASVSHLVNSFKKEYGVTPSTYRQRT